MSRMVSGLEDLEHTFENAKNVKHLVQLKLILLTLLKGRPN